MNKILKNTILSIATCAVVFSLQGCGEDRAGITPTEAEKLSGSALGTTTITPSDKDGDGISDTDEINGWTNECGETYTSDPNRWDSDNDGMSDGYEKNHSYNHDGGKYCTNPNKEDTDSDGIKDGDEQMKNVGSSYVTDPTDSDTDNDGLLDGDEVNATNAPQNLSDVLTDPTKKDSDGDRLSDGYEATVSHTDPNNQDSDNDGVTDGIEVCGTSANNQNQDGMIVSTAGGVNPNLSNNFYDDILDLTEDNSINANGLNGLSDNRCQTPANYNNDNTIDAKDSTNDSDGDKRPNDMEKSKGTDPLHAGKDYDKTVTTADVNNSVANKYYYPWITQTSDGEKMVDAGFVYVPKNASEEGFWFAKYEAVCEDGTNSCTDKVVFNDGNTSARNNIDRDGTTSASSLVENSQVDLSVYTNDYKIYIPQKAQYDHLLTVKDSWDNGVLTVGNKYNDPNIAADYKGEIYKLEQGTLAEYTKTNNSFDYTDGSQNHYLDNANKNTGVGFRSATDYLNPNTDYLK